MHRAEAILNAIETNLTGLAITGANVQRDRVYPPEKEKLPALSITQGEESPLAPANNVSYQDSILEVSIHIYVKASDFNTQFNNIKAQVYAALMADIKQGVEYVIDTKWQGDSAPNISGEAEQKTLKAEMRFAVWYRHSLTSKEA